MSYFDEARVRARRRKSRWNLLLIPLVTVPLGLFWAVTTLALQTLHGHLHPEELPLLRQATSLPQLVVGLVPFFAWLAPSMVLANCIAWMIRPARLALDREAEGFPGTDFVLSNRQLLHFAAVVTPVSLLLGVLAAVV